MITRWTKKKKIISDYSQMKCKEWKGVSRRHSLCFLLRHLPFPPFYLFNLTSANPQVQHFISLSKEMGLKTPSLSEHESDATISLTYSQTLVDPWTDPAILEFELPFQHLEMTPEVKHNLLGLKNIKTGCSEDKLNSSFSY